MAGGITIQPKQGRQAGPMNGLCILLCLCGHSMISHTVAHCMHAYNGLTYFAMVVSYMHKMFIKLQLKFVKSIDEFTFTSEVLL